MKTSTSLTGRGSSERSGGNRLENMSTRPSTVVTHRVRKGRQLVPSLRVRLDARGTKLAQEHPLQAVGMPHFVESAEPLERARIVERLCRAVIADLRLPGVIPLAPGGKLPDEVSRSEPLLVLAVMTRCSGPVWLRERAAALERLASGRPVRLLLQPDLFRHVLDRLDTADWEAQVFARAQGSESWR